MNGREEKCKVHFSYYYHNKITSAHACCIYLKLMPVISIIYAI